MTSSRADFIIDLLPNGSLAVSFPYDLTALQVVRSVPGRRWHKDNKFWEVPRTSLKALSAQAARVGIGVALSERVRQALNLGRERQQKLLAVKTDVTPLQLPTNTNPYAFQYAGIRFAKYALHSFHGALIGDCMGLGKSFEALSLVVLHEKLSKVLILCPATLKYTWAGQIDEHYPQLSYTIIDGSPEQRSEQWAAPSRIKIANYELLVPGHDRNCTGSNAEKRKAGHKCNCQALSKDIDLRLQEWDLVIADELAAYLKSFKAQRTKRAKKIRRKYTLGLSGIFLENNLDELHSVIDFIIPGLLGPGYLFHEQHVVRNQWGVTIGWRGIEDIKQRIAPYYIRRTKNEVLSELPPKVYNDVLIEMSAAEWELYDDIRNQIREKIKDNPKLTISNILTELLRLKQAACDPRLLDVEGIESSKLAAVRDIMAAAGEHKVVLYTFFAQLAKLLAAELTAPLIAGGVAIKDRAKIIAEFQAGQYPCLVSTDAGAYGITLTAADIIIHVDLPWNPAKMRQREDRLHRIGQKGSVQVVSLICRRTVDEKIRGILHRKLQLVKSVLDEELPEDNTGSITKDELLQLLED